MRKKAPEPPRPGMGIALRIALMSWIVTLITLFIFASLTIPQGKKTFLENLESKANSVAVSLYDAAASAAVNDDFASVVAAGLTMLSGDPELDFLIVLKNGGYTLILEQTGWRVENVDSPYWQPEKRAPFSEIADIPMFDRRIFHYAQPFDYSGIEWGWIHIGLSLSAYDKSVSALYRNTVYLSLGCICFSLMISLMYAGQLVRPILRLRHVMQQIAEGDLDVRADQVRGDEIGSLAASVNIMAEALLRRDHILESVRYAAQQFIRGAKWEETINRVLRKVALAARVRQAVLFMNHADDNGMLCCSLQYEWEADDIPPQLENPIFRNVCYSAAGFGAWADRMEKNRMMEGRVSEMGKDAAIIFEPLGIFSLIAIPVFVDGKWWGFLGLGASEKERQWTRAEKDSLLAGVDMLGSTISRQRIQEALLEAKSTLEKRVQERTRELQDQVAAKEAALTELSAVQSSLLAMSRASGMAEVATGVLHNVGNVLNSVNVSCVLLTDQLNHSCMGNVSKIADLITEQEEDLVRFFRDDPRGAQIPGYLRTLASALHEENELMQKEAYELMTRVDHIKEIVSMQQSYSRVSGVRETILPHRLMEDTLQFVAGALGRHNITVKRQYASLPPITVDKHKVLQIFLNLINNAKHACMVNGEKDRRITLRICNPEKDRIHMEVEDNGIGILPEHLTRIFEHGFTTRTSGHGFGLHIGALSAKELGGRLCVHSDGLGHGAVFTLELPYVKGVQA